MVVVGAEVVQLEGVVGRDGKWMGEGLELQAIMVR